MPLIRAYAVRFVESGQPDIVECAFTDAWGREWKFVEKVPVVSQIDLDENTSYPQPVAIACEVISRRTEADGREVVTVDTELGWHMESVEGQTRFDVLPEQLDDE